MKKYVFDTSALITFIENEAGVDYVEKLLLEALEGNIQIFISVVSRIELYYISLREQNKNIAEERLKLIDDLPLLQKSLDSEMIPIIGEIKATKPMSFADCCIAALAKFNDATIIHKDPEYEQLKGDIKQYILPYKSVSH